MCLPNTPAAIKVLAAFCFCVNMFNLIYLIMRYHDLLPPDALQVKEQIERVMPDVKNLDKYLARRQGAVFLSSLAGISVVFDFILFVGVEQEQPGLILSAWLWGVVDCSFDAAVGIASGNFTFMDWLALEPEVGTTTEPVEKSLSKYRKMYGNTTTQQQTTSTTTTNDEGPRSNDTEYARGRKQPNQLYRKVHGNPTMSHKMPITSATEDDPRTVYAPSQKVWLMPQVDDHETIAANTTAFRLSEEQTAVLVVYVILRLSFKLIALAGIKDYASYVMTRRQRQQLEKRLDYETQETNIRDSSGAHTQDSIRGFSMPLPVMMPPAELAAMPPEPLAPPPDPVPHQLPPHPPPENADLGFPGS